MRQHDTLDIVMCIDRRHFVGVSPMIRSIIVNTEDPRTVAFHITVGAGETEELAVSLRENFPDPSFRYQIREFHCTPFLDDYIRAGKDLHYAAYSSSVMNFSRFYLGEIYPELGKFAYLDVDIIVQGDIAELFEEATLERHDLAAVRIASFGTWEGGFNLKSAHLQDFDLDEPVFNAGVYVTDLTRWPGTLPELKHWIKIHRRSLQTFVFGTQSLLNLAFYRKVQLLSPEWNVRPLGVDENIPEQDLRRAKILHWAGPRKPWTQDGLYKAYWNPYAPGRS